MENVEIDKMLEKIKKEKEENDNFTYKMLDFMEMTGMFSAKVIKNIFKLSAKLREISIMQSLIDLEDKRKINNLINKLEEIEIKIDNLIKYIDEEGE